MPRETGSGGAERAFRAERPRGGGRSRRPLELTDELRQALLPWLDLDEVGPEGLGSWLLSIVGALPRPSAGDHVLDRDASYGTTEERLNQMAYALAECASDRARTNFQASEYFRENRALARRVKALEAMLETRMAAGQMERVDLTDPEADAATHRYMPVKRS